MFSEVYNTPVHATLKNSLLSSESLNMLLAFCNSVFTLFNTYLRMVVFTLFVYRVCLKHCCCIAIHVIRNILIMKIPLNVFFPLFQLTTYLLLLLQALSSAFYITATKSHSRCFNGEKPFQVPQKH